MRKFLVFVKDKKLEPNGVRADYLFGDINDAFVIYREKRLKTYLRFIYHLIKFDHTVYLMGFDTIVVLILFFLNYKDFFYDTGDFEYALSRSFRNRFFSYIVFILERWVLKNARKVIVRTDSLKEFFQKSYRKDNIYVLRDGVDIDIFSRFKGIPEKFTIGIIGNLNVLKEGYVNGSDVIKCIEILKDKGIDVKGIIVGKGKAIKFLKDMIKNKDIDVEIIEGWFSFEELGKILERITIGVNIQTNDDVGNMRLGGKIPVYLASSRFVISTNVGDCKRLLPEEFLIDYEGSFDKKFPERLADRIMDIINDKKRIEKRFSCANIAKKYFDYRLLKADFKKILYEET
uniref:Glycosyltransferase n=1 Tax=candidate division WOR-3 bacterium TaxID=2052148 RepID=A0A7C4YSY1_UNCW3